jgi:hypothetical protein
MTEGFNANFGVTRRGEKFYFVHEVTFCRGKDTPFCADTHDATLAPPHILH